MTAAIRCEDVTFGYLPERMVLRNLTFAVDAGLFTGIAGPNGAGKTTLVKLLCGLLRAQKGSIVIDGKPVESYDARGLARRAAVVHQEGAPVFDFTVGQVVSMGRTPYVGTFGFEDEADENAIVEAMQATDVLQFAERTLAHLSGGERQRVFLARALAQETPLLLLDEPTSFLDMRHQVAIFDLLKKMQREKKKTIISVTHDVNLAGQYCDKVLLIGADASYEFGRAEEVLSKERIEKVFEVETIAVQMGRRKFFMPVGKSGIGDETRK